VLYDETIILENNDVLRLVTSAKGHDVEDTVTSRWFCCQGVKDQRVVPSCIGKHRCMQLDNTLSYEQHATAHLPFRLGQVAPAFKSDLPLAGQAKLTKTMREMLETY
jgi:hypothetical protein